MRTGIHSKVARLRFSRQEYRRRVAGYIDHVELLSSPPLSDIEAGCEVTGMPFPVTICPPNMPPDFGCNSAPWTASAYYTDALSGVRQWTSANSLLDSSTCRFPNGNTSTIANQAWKAMSIVDGNLAVYNYPKTDMTAWLCSSVNGGGPMNNSSSQSQLFWANYTDPSQLWHAGLSINGVANCNGDVTNANPPQLGAIEQEMETKCVSHH